MTPVETGDGSLRGRSTIDWNNRLKKPPNALVLDRVDAAIEGARGGKDGLNGHDGNELAQLAGTVREDVDRGDIGAATTAAQTLSDRARQLTAHLDKKLRDPLLAAIDSLVQALSATT